MEIGPTSLTRREMVYGFEPTGLTRGEIDEARLFLHAHPDVVAVRRELTEWRLCLDVPRDASGAKNFAFWQVEAAAPTLSDAYDLAVAIAVAHLLTI